MFGNTGEIKDTKKTRKGVLVLHYRCVVQIMINYKARGSKSESCSHDGVTGPRKAKKKTLNQNDDLLLHSL